MSIRSLPFSLVLDADGDGAGATAGNVDGSSTAVVRRIVAPTDCRLKIARLIYSGESTSAVAAEKFLGITALTNGLDIEWVRGGKTIDLLDGNPIKSNANWGRVCYDITAPEFGTGNEFVQVRWTFAKAGLDLILNEGDTLLARINDDCSGVTIVNQLFTVQGVIEGLNDTPTENDAALARFFGS